MPRITLIVSTRKGLWLYRSADRARWEADGPHHFGCLVHHAVLDTRDGRTLLAGVRTGHLGPTVMRTDDGGRSWREARQPPAFRTGEPRGRAVDHVFWLTPFTRPSRASGTPAPRPRASSAARTAERPGRASTA